MPARGVEFSMWFWVGAWSILPAIIWLILGCVRWRRVGDHPHYRKCRYDLGATEIAITGNQV